MLDPRAKEVLPVPIAQHHWPVGTCSWKTICEMVEAGIIQRVKSLDQVGAASLDLRLGPRIKVEGRGHVEINKRETGSFFDIEADKETGRLITLSPGQCILAESVERFSLPLDVAVMVYTRSTPGRVFFEHLTSGFCDPGWNNSVLTLELKNCSQFHTIGLHAGDSVVQMKFEILPEPVPFERSYAARGHYNGDGVVTGAKGGEE